MKVLNSLLFVIILLVAVAKAQNNDDAAASASLLRAPKASEIAKVTFDKSTVDTRIFTRESLLAVLPQLAPGFDPNYGSDLASQNGTFTLRDGTVLTWSSVYKDSLMIGNGKTSRLFFAVAREVDKKLALPKVEDISKISMMPSRKKIYTRASLIKIIPQLAPTRAYLIIKIKQRGSFTLKDGSVLKWATGYNGQLVIYDASRQVLYGTYSNGELTLPKVEDVKEIQAAPSKVRWFTPESLLEALPKFVPGGNYQPKMIWQNGSIELKDGTILTWRAGSEKMLVLYTRGGEKYFQLPPKAEKSETSSPKILKKTILRGSIENDDFQMTLDPDDGGVLSGTYFFDKQGWTKASVLRGKIDAKGTITLREYTADGKQTNEFTGKLSVNPEDSNLEIEGARKNLRTNKKVPFSASDEAIDFDNGCHLNTQAINEKNKLMKFEIEAAYPEILGRKNEEMSGFNQAVKSFVIGAADEFREEMLSFSAEEVKSRGDRADYSFYTNYHLYYADNDFIGVLFSSSEYLGQAHAMSYFKTLNYDLKNNRPLELAGLFRPGAKYLETISAFCLKNLRRRPPQRGFDFAKELWTEALEPDKENFQAWCLTKHGLLIIFSPEQIAPYSVDPPFVLIPFDELKDIAAPDGALAQMSKKAILS